MKPLDEILIKLGRIEGELIGIRKLSERVTRLEAWLHWIRGALVVAYVYVSRHIFAK